MQFSKIYQTNKHVLSFEFFPPKVREDLPVTCALMRELRELSPHFMTVTYGAGGGTRDLTRELVSFIHHELKITAAAHLTCAGHSADELDVILDDLAKSGISNVLALRGDPPKGETKFVKHPQGYASAVDLVAKVNRRKDFSVAVAGYPETHREAASPKADLEYLKRKVDAGAEVIITQLFFDNAQYFEFLNRAKQIGISVPVVPGIMPIANAAQVRRFTTMCGATIPKSLADKLASYEANPESVVKFGIEFATRQSEELLTGGAPGLHFYTLNKSHSVTSVVKSLSPR